jgi:hypothetical protein
LAGAVQGTVQDAHSIQIAYADFARLSATHLSSIQRHYAPEDHDFTPSSGRN